MIPKALHLSGFSKSVFLITQNEELDAAETLVNKFEKRENIKVVKARVKAILGDGSVKAVSIWDLKSNEEKEISVDGAFISV